LSLTVLDDGTVSIDGATGAITIEILEPAEFAGTYTQDIDGRPLTTDLVTADRFVCLVRPEISGSPIVGETLSMDGEGLWLYVGAEPTFTYQWNNNGMAIAGATSGSYTLTAGENGQTVTMSVIASEGGDSVAAASLGIAITGSVAFDADFVAGHSDGADLLAGDFAAYGLNNGLGAGVTMTSDHTAGGARINHLSNSRSVAYYNTTDFGPDQEVEIELVDWNGANANPNRKNFGVLARAAFAGADSQATGYRLAQSAFSNTLNLLRDAAGVTTNLAGLDIGVTLGPGDRLRLRVTGQNPVQLSGSYYRAATGAWVDDAVTASDSSADRVLDGLGAFLVYAHNYADPNGAVVTNFKLKTI
jgi:hypothetical protein